MKVQCIKCKGRGYCGREFCPIYAKAESMFKVEKALDKDSFFGSGVSPFVGRFNYPNINVGILSPPEQKEDAWLYDAPRYWAGHSFELKQLVDLRSNLINSRFKANVKGQNKFLDTSRELSMASKPADIEITLEQKPKFRINLNPDTAPTGPNAMLKKAEITENVKVDSKVEKVVGDIDFKATNAMNYLYEKGFDENFISRLLSIGNLGVKTERKLVPTRWSITAVDDALAKKMLADIRTYEPAEHSVYFGSYLGNYYLVMLFPEPWSYELFEMYMPKASWNISSELQFTTDYEGYDGRKDYAAETTGGYYTARLAVIEQLSKMKKQATAVVLRFITGEYAVPLGVWVTREASRNAMKSKPMVFSEKELTLKYARALINKKFGFDIDSILNKSTLMKNMKTQTKLAGFI